MKRKKKIEFPGLIDELWVAALTLGQIDDFSRNYEESKKDPSIRYTKADVVAWSLKNLTGDESWNREKVRNEFDPELLNHTFGELMAFSGIKLTDDTESEPGKSPGETLAASSK